MSRKGLALFFRDQLADEFLARTINCVVLIKLKNFVLVGSDEFRQNRGRWSWFGHDRMNAQIFWYTKLRAKVGAKYGGLCH